jgi:hypothetical protein
MKTTPTTALAIGLAAMCASGLAARAQDTRTTTTTTTIEIKGGKDVTVNGCLARRPTGDYMLTDVNDPRLVEPVRYALVTSEDLSKRVGERVEVQGRAVTDGDGSVSVESKTSIHAANVKDQETKSKTLGTSGTYGMAFLGVSSMKTLATVCP